MKEKPELTVVLPCYNESGNIAEILRRFAPVARAARLELILVDNGSTDDTAAVLAQELGPSHPFARGVRVERNIGYGHGIMTGLAAAAAPAVAWTHADLQTPPEDVLLAYRRWRELGPRTLVKGRRGKRAAKDEVFVSRVYNALACGVLGLPALDINGQPKVFDRELLGDAARGPSDISYDLFVLWRARRRGFRIEELAVDFEPRRHGASKWAYNRAARARMILLCLRRVFEFRLGLWPR